MKIKEIKRILLKLQREEVLYLAHREWCAPLSVEGGAEGKVLKQLFKLECWLCTPQDQKEVREVKLTKLATLLASAVKILSDNNTLSPDDVVSETLLEMCFERRVQS